VQFEKAVGEKYPSREVWTYKSTRMRLKKFESSMTYLLSWERNKLFNYYFLTLNNKCQIVSFSKVMIEIWVHEGGHTRSVIVQL
jgi:hypothetical protein